MKRIGNSKEPTPKIMLAIVSNLRDHLNCYVSLSIVSNAHTHISEASTDYGIYSTLDGHKYFKTWPEIIESYRRTMKEDRLEAKVV